ncbi:MAG: UPF0179 family protein [Methanomassiliicoccales archaeon]|jgi:uncharacterized protein (UPF0179 family)|nr:UPF0179 family protein [Methanomassiliicoccales archaeon]
MMVIVTLIGERQAKEGAEFTYRGPLTDCRECKLKAVCFNLDAGSVYRITALRDVHHECRIHEDGVRVVEVEKIPVRCAVMQKYALEGSVVTLEEIKCLNIGCDRYRICHPIGMEKNSKCKIAKVIGEINCPEGNKLVEVEVA